MDEIVPNGIGRVFTWDTGTSQWKPSGGCWALTSQDVVTNYRVVHAVEYKDASGEVRDQTWWNLNKANQGTRKWRPLQVRVLTKPGMSTTATIVKASKRLNFVVLRCPDLTLHPLPVNAEEVQRFWRIVHCHYPIARDMRGKTKLTLQLPNPSLDWSIVSSVGVVESVIDTQHNNNNNNNNNNSDNVIGSDYQAFPDSCGYPVMRWANDEWVVCGMHVAVTWQLVATAAASKVGSPETKEQQSYLTPSSQLLLQDDERTLRSTAPSHSDESNDCLVVKLPLLDGEPSKRQGGGMSFFMPLSVLAQSAKWPRGTAQETHNSSK